MHIAILCSLKCNIKYISCQLSDGGEIYNSFAPTGTLIYLTIVLVYWCLSNWEKFLVNFGQHIHREC